MTDNFEKKVAVDGPVVNAGELGSSTFSPGQALPAGPLGLGQRWTVARKREVVLRLLRDEPVQLLSRQLGVEIFRLEQWREKAIGGIGALAPALGAQGLDHLKQLFTDFSKEDLSTPNEDDQEVIGWSSAGPIYADTYAERRRDSVVRMALTDIADAQGDVDAFAVQPRAKQHLQDIWMAETKGDAEKAFDFFLEAYGAKYDKAVACLAKDRDVLLAFYDFPAEHWEHIRTTNPIESTFATVRLRTTKTKGCLSRMTALTMVFKLCQSASKKWRRLNGSHHIAAIIQGVKFKDGEKLTERAA